MYRDTPRGITPPTPGLEREEPEFSPWEEDIPSDDGHASARSERRQDSTPGRSRSKLERE
jgi:hypothetical protein